jgi:hypothetical protein
MRHLARKSPTPAEIVGPRVPGSVYLDGTRGVMCEVLAVETSPGVWVAERDLDGPLAGETRRHCYPWDPETDRIVSPRLPSSAP